MPEQTVYWAGTTIPITTRPGQIVEVDDMTDVVPRQFNPADPAGIVQPDPYSQFAGAMAGGIEVVSVTVPPEDRNIRTLFRVLVRVIGTYLGERVSTVFEFAKDAVIAVGDEAVYWIEKARDEKIQCSFCQEKRAELWCDGCNKPMCITHLALCLGEEDFCTECWKEEHEA